MPKERDPDIPRTSANQAIAQIMRNALKNKTLPEGTVLLEGPIAALFKSSRTPVKQALITLEAEGLVRRFEGRGLLAGTQGAPQRIKITPAMLMLDPENSDYPKTFVWENYYYDFENTVILGAVLGPARINELALARYYGISRTVAGDILNRATETGVVVRDEKSRWLVNPLDETRFLNLYELRVLLEPAALETAIERAPESFVDGLRTRLVEATEKFPAVQGSEWDDLEQDLHIRMLSYASNVEIIEALKRTHCVLVAGKHIQRAIRGVAGIDAFMDEHLTIVDAIRRRDPEEAKNLLSRHLMASRRKAIERVETYRAICEMEPVPYLIR